MTPRLAFDDVALARGGRMLFENLSFALGPGDAALVIGPNGVGKSSLLRLAAGLLFPAVGSIGRDGAMALADEWVALDLQHALGNALAFWAKLDGVEIGAVSRALAALGLAELAEVPVRLLSTGQRRRAGIARAVASGALIWLLDEPGNGLDVESENMLADAMSMHRADGGIVLAASHQRLELPNALIIALGQA